MTTTFVAFDATLRDLVEDGMPVSPDCPYCEEPISGETRSFGGGLMHLPCFDAFGDDLDSAFPDVLAPIHPQLFEDVDWEEQGQDALAIESEEAEALQRLHQDTPF